MYAASITHKIIYDVNRNHIVSKSGHSMSLNTNDTVHELHANNIITLH